MYPSAIPSTANSRRNFLLNTGRVALGVAAMAKFARGQSERPFTEHRIPRDGFHLYAREYDGAGPTFVLLHGFPDNLHIYDRLVPFLVEQGRRVVAFDFLGFGASDKPDRYSYTFEQQNGDLLAVVDFLKLDKVVPVAHDAGGVAAINFVLSERKRASALCLLNTFYGDAPTLRFPELIDLFADSKLKALSQAVLTDPKQFAWLLNFQNRQFMAAASSELREHMDNFLQPIINQNFAQKPSAGPAFAQLTAQLFPGVKANDERLDALSRLDLPVTIVWGKLDPYLNAGVAQDFAARFKRSSLHLLEAGHWPQIDFPDDVAQNLVTPA